MIFSSRNIFLASLFLLIGLFLLLPILPRQNVVFKPAPYAALLDAFKPAVESHQAPDRAVSEPILIAEAGIVYNPLDQTILYQKNVDSQHGIASITKIMTALIAVERVGMQEIIVVSNHAVRTEGNEGNISTGEHFTLEQLMKIMLTESSNDAAVAIAEYIGRLYGAVTFEESQKLFVQLMNEKAYQLRLHNTYFQNPTGLDIDEEQGIISNYSSVYDIARLTTYALRYPSLWKANSASATLYSEEGIEHVLSTTHNLIEYEAGVLSGKTGFTDTTGGTLVTIAEIPAGQLTVIVVLGSQRDGRFTDTEKLINWLRTL